MAKVSINDLDPQLYEFILGSAGARETPTAARAMSPRERELREQAAGSERRVYRAASAVFIPSVAESFSKLFDKKFSEEEKKQAKEQLKSEFGVNLDKKPKDPQILFKKIGKSISQVSDSISRIAQTVDGLKSSVFQIGMDTQKTLGVVNKVLNQLKMESALEDIRSVVFKENSGGNPMSEMKPETIQYQEKEYLYYKNAPEGRKFYEKSTTGTAGKIASKKIQPSLMKLVAKTAKRKPTTPMSASIDNAVQALDADSYIRKNELLKLLQEINENADNAKREMRTDEQRKILEDALEDALQTVIIRNPNLLKCQGGNIDIPTRRPTRKTTPTPTQTPKGGLMNRIGGFLRGAGVVGVAGSITYGIGSAMDSSMKGRADSVIADIAKNGSVQEIVTMLQAGTPQQKAYKLQEIQKYIIENPESASKITEAISTASGKSMKPEKQSDVSRTQPSAALQSPRNRMDIGKTQLQSPSTTNNMQSAQLQSPRATNNAQTIIDRNRNISDQSRLVGAVAAQQPVVNNISNNIMPPAMTKQEMNPQITNNTDNTFNRLMMQDFEHPYSHTSVNLG